MDFGALPPEVNSGRMYAGPGSAPVLAAAVAFDGLAADLQLAASSQASMIAGLAALGWRGPTSLAMAGAVAPYVAWMRAAAAQAEQAGMRANAAASAFEAAFAMTVPPAVIAANRALVTALVASNFLGQNSAAIAAAEAHYGEMWAQDATAMYRYAGASATAATLTPLSPPPQVINPAGLAGLAGATAAAVTHAPAALSQLAMAVPTALHGLALPALAVSPGAALSALQALEPLIFPVYSMSAMSSSGMSLINTLSSVARTLGAAAPAAAHGATMAGSALGGAATAAARGLGQAGLGASALTAGLGRAVSMGTLSVPHSWTALASAIGHPGAAALPAAAAGVSGGAGGPANFMGGGVPVGHLAGRGGLVANELQIPARAFVMPRPPAAG